MAGTRPGESNGSATGSIHVVYELSPRAISFVRDYDIRGLAAMLKSLSHCSFEEQMEAFSTNLESFRWSNIYGAYSDEEEDDDGEVDEDYDVSDDEDDENENEKYNNGEQEAPIANAAAAA